MLSIITTLIHRISIGGNINNLIIGIISGKCPALGYPVRAFDRLLARLERFGTDASPRQQSRNALAPSNTC